VKCHLHLPDGQTIRPNIPFITTLSGGTWVENTVGTIMDEKGIVHLYLHNSSLLVETVNQRIILGRAKEMDTFEFNMLESEEAVAAIFGTETMTLCLGPPTWGHEKPPTNPIKHEMIQVMVDCSISMEWLLDDCLDVISESKTDLGHSNMVIHDIELTDGTKQFLLPPDHYEKIRQ
jgi:hypothetical protein